MLEAINLTKVYKIKKGVPVKALDNVSIRFPEKGMVFLLGKSGSGKSTLLNLLGGLDKYDSGEIKIKGVSSKDFKQKHFDSYRNTYLGFIFQEYNVLDDFTVGANIALSIELQGRKAKDSEINEILKQVDLEGYGSRKPNELSGGQKQRVAIARALVKKPEIIMADEPTGALDSNTGKQVFDTLKKLSKEKLVIVVSHDREFAEKYADRIIELSDGHIISDVELNDNSEAVSENIEFSAEGITVSAGYHLTEEDRKAINDYIDKVAKGDINITVSKSSGKKFVKTDESKIKEAGGKFSLIKSRLPFHNAIRIGASGLKHKKIRLAVTILLSCIAFGLFGLADTFGSYNHVKTCTNSLIDSKIDYLSIAKERKMGKDYWVSNRYNFSDEELSKISDKTNINMHGVFSDGSGLSFESNTNPDKKTTETDYDIYRRSFSGFAAVDADILNEFGYKLLCGTLPDENKDEIAVSKYIFDVFKKTQYTDGKKVKNEKGNEVTVYQDINLYEDLIGKTLTLNGKKFTVTGIVDTKTDISRYERLTVKVKNKSKSENLIDYILNNEFTTAASNSFLSVAMTGKAKLNAIISQQPDIYRINYGWFGMSNESMSVNPDYLTTIDKIDLKNVKWINGAKTELAKNEVIVYQNSLQNEDIFDENGNLNASKILPMEYWCSLYKDNAYETDFLKEKGFGEKFNIVGIIPANEKLEYLSSTAVVNSELVDLLCDKSDRGYSYAIGNLKGGYKEISPVVNYCYSADKDIKYPIQNSVTYELDSINSVLKSLSKVFLYIGIGFALFAALMLSNFIGTSISYKKKDIGILRAIGSRSNDVFRIFFSESAIIALVNFILSSAGVLAATIIINGILRTNYGILITVLSFGIRQIALLLAVSIAVAFTASFIPVKKIASKRPIDAIREK